MNNPLCIVVMAGGSGTRFWPASRSARPKQFLPISGAQPMIVETVTRLGDLVPLERVFVVTAADQVPLVREALPELAADNVLGEPQARNTAACVGYAAQVLSERFDDPVMAVLPADHVIEPAASLRATLAAAATVARTEESLITFGIEPDHPATGYGYVEAGARTRQAEGVDVFEVRRFVEKPNRERAEGFLAAGRFYWNSGMFVWRTSVILDAYRAHSPEIAAGLARLGEGADVHDVYPSLPKQPVDVAIMEQASNVRLMPIDYRWSDVGSWAALPDVHAADDDGNVPVLARDTQLLAEEARDCIVFAEEQGELVALLGVDDLIVVRSGKTTLVCPRARAQDVKRIVERLGEEAPEHL